MHCFVAIDGDHSSPKHTLKLLDSLRVDYNLIVTLYGSKEACNSKKWREISKAYSFVIMECISPIDNKNTTDAAIITDVMDCSIDNILIVSSDTDFSYTCRTLIMKGKNIMVASKSNVKDYYSNIVTKFYDLSIFEERNIDNDFKIINEFIKSSKRIRKEKFEQKLSKKINNFDLTHYGYSTLEEFLLDDRISCKYLFGVDEKMYEFYDVKKVIKMIFSILKESKNQLSFDKIIERLAITVDKNCLYNLIDSNSELNINNNNIIVRI
ncbi:MAG: NYN domain-containing protein [Peptostreptococcaceae bacterium]